MISHLVSALAYLHNINVVHRDVKPENLLVSITSPRILNNSTKCVFFCLQVDFDGENVRTLKLADFGLACEVTGPLYTVCGTPTYVAPEILAESGYGLKVKTLFLLLNVVNFENEKT